MAFYKFLQNGHEHPHGRFSDFAWPVPEAPGGAEWVVATLPLEVCRRGIHVCRPDDLPHWLDDELWEVEVAGEVVEDDDKVIVERARLVAPVGGWPEMAGPFRDGCVLALRDLAVDVAHQEELHDEAVRLAGCGSLESIEGVLGPLAAALHGDIVTVLEFLGDALEYARLGETAVVAFIAAHAADRAPVVPGRRLRRGMTPFDAERRRQGGWLKANLGMA